MSNQEPTFFEKLRMTPTQLWADYKGFFLLFGLLILIIKFREVIFDLLVKSSGKLVENATKESNSLQQQQNQANNQANQLIDEAKKLGENKPEVDEDWHKK